MISYEQARDLVLAYLAELEAAERRLRDLRKDLTPQERKVLGLEPVDDVLKPVIAEGETIEYDFGWVFFWTCVDASGAAVTIAGNAPLICDRHSGQLLETGTAHATEHYVKNYRETGDPHGALGNRVEVYAWEKGANTLGAIKATRDATGIGLANAKRYIDDTMKGRTTIIDTPDNETAQRLVEQLALRGFKAGRLAESSR